jgi:23S rRNA (cytidine1920-2'-O)/16S rRNA (cytidine1409-2'-O)-methyltransferase
VTAVSSRLDVALVDRGLARSRGHAQELVRRGAVQVNGSPAVKPARPVGETDSITVHTTDGQDPLDRRWVSRAAGKLLGALADLPDGGPSLRDARAVDVGACTGGFTQVLLDQGARHVSAVDVGHGQLAAVLRSDERVTDLSGHNVRDLEAETVGGPVDVVVADLSFISLTLVIDRLHDLVRPGGDLLLLVKPQFEVGRDGLDGRGVVRAGPGRREALLRVLRAATDLGLELRGAVASRTTGQEGNVEYILWLARPAGAPVGRTWQAVCQTIDDMLDRETPEEDD